MERIMLKSKIHRAVLTGAELNYVGSVGIDLNLLEAADIVPGEQVQVLNLNNGSRLITYAIEAERGSGTIELNGPAAREGFVGDHVIIITYCHVNEEEMKHHQSCVVHVNEKNEIVDL